MGHSTDINENEHLQYIFNDYKSGIEHGILVANLTYELAKRLKLDERECYELKIAGMMHDIGKLKLSEYLYGRNSGELSVEEMKYMRMHSKISFDVLKNYDYSDNIMKLFSITMSATMEVVILIILRGQIFHWVQEFLR